MTSFHCVFTSSPIVRPPFFRNHSENAAMDVLESPALERRYPREAGCGKGGGEAVNVLVKLSSRLGSRLVHFSLADHFTDLQLLPESCSVSIAQKTHAPYA